MERTETYQRKLILQLPLHQQFELYCGVLVHKLVNRGEHDFNLLVNIGVVLVKEGRRVEVLPALHEKDIDFRRKVLPGVRMNKNPDLRINGEYWEVEAPEWPYKRTNIDNRIRKGQKQAEKIILFFAKEVNVRSVERIITRRFKDHARLKKVEIWVNYVRRGTLIK